MNSRVRKKRDGKGKKIRFNKPVQNTGSYIKNIILVKRKRKMVTTLRKRCKQNIEGFDIWF